MVDGVASAATYPGVSPKSRRECTLARLRFSMWSRSSGPPLSALSEPILWRKDGPVRRRERHIFGCTRSAFERRVGSCCNKIGVLERRVGRTCTCHAKLACWVCHVTCSVSVRPTGANIHVRSGAGPPCPAVQPSAADQTDFSPRPPRRRSSPSIEEVPPRQSKDRTGGRSLKYQIHT